MAKRRGYFEKDTLPFTKACIGDKPAAIPCNIPMGKGEVL